MQKLVEVLLRDHADCTVVFGLNSRGSLTACEECNLSKVLARVEGTHEVLLPLLVFHETLALTLRYDKEIECRLALLNFDFFRLTHDKFDFSYHVVFNLLVESKDQILLKLLRENESGDFFFEGWTDHSEKLTQLVLVIQCLLNVLQVRDDSILDLLGKFHVFHRCVSCVDLSLELS